LIEKFLEEPLTHILCSRTFSETGMCDKKFCKCL